MKKIHFSWAEKIKTNQIKETHDNLLKVPDDFQNVNSKEDVSKRSGNVSDADVKLLKDFSKKVTDLEKNFKVFISSINIDNIKSELSKIRDYKESCELSGIFNAFDIIYKYIDEPFSNDLLNIDSQGLFNACKYLANKLSVIKTNSKYLSKVI